MKLYRINKNLNKKLKNIDTSSNNRFIAIPFVLVFAALAASLLPNLFAATSTVATEAESTSQTTNTTKTTDATASDGSALVFNTNIGGDRVTVEDLIYDHFGPPYRKDGTVYQSVTVGAPPWGAHEALPVAGNPSWNFYEGSLFRTKAPWSDYMNIWGQLFPTANTRKYGVRLQIRNPQLWYLGPNDNIWRKVKPTQSPDAKVNGNFQLPGSFQGTGWPSDIAGIRSEGTGQGWSLKLSPLADVLGGPGSFHWFYSGEYTPKPAVPAGMRAVFVAAEMRLIHDVDRSINLDTDVNVIASIGSDNWPVATGPRPDGKQISGFVQPRMKFVTSEWDWYSGHSFAEWWVNGVPQPSRMNGDLLRKYPPPIVGSVRQK